MGRLIDIDKARKEYSNLTDLTMNDTTLLLTLFGVLDNAPTVEAIPKADIQKALKEGSKDIGENVLAIVREEYISKADYENRLKADMAAMITDLQLEIEELKSYESADGQDLVMLADIGIMLQEKINALKGANNE